MIITYPLNDIEYDASDAETYLSTRTSGVYSSDDHFAISITGNRQVTISPGLAWINNGQFRGKSVVSTEAVVLEIPAASGSLSRIDLIVLRFDATKNASTIAVKQGTESSTPSIPAVVRTEELYELGLYAVTVKAGSVSVYTSDILSLILDEKFCGIMRDGVTGIPTAQLQAQAAEIIASLISLLNEELTNIVSATVTKGTGTGAPSCTVEFSDDKSNIVFRFENINGKDGVSVTHSWVGKVLTFESASGKTSIDFSKVDGKLTELVRFTESGSFDPSGYPTVDGLYTVVLQGAGGSGPTHSSGYGGGAGAMAVVANLPLPSGIVPVTVGKGGVGVRYTGNDYYDGNDGGGTSFGGFFVPGGKGGPYSDAPTPVTAGIFTANVGTKSAGGDSLLGKGGKNSASGNGAPGGIGAGGGGSSVYNAYSGAGGDGVVIIYGIRKE